MICATIPWLANGLVSRSIGDDAEERWLGDGESAECDS